MVFTWQDVAQFYYPQPSPDFACNDSDFHFTVSSFICSSVQQARIVCSTDDSVLSDEKYNRERGSDVCNNRAPYVLDTALSICVGYFISS